MAKWVYMFSEGNAEIDSAGLHDYYGSLHRLLHTGQEDFGRNPGSDL